jgi:hypothetical protein
MRILGTGSTKEHDLAAGAVIGYHCSAATQPRTSRGHLEPRGPIPLPDIPEATECRILEAPKQHDPLAVAIIGHGMMIAPQRPCSGDLLSAPRAHDVSGREAGRSEQHQRPCQPDLQWFHGVMDLIGA